jgi:hypothetical protein
MQPLQHDESFEYIGDAKIGQPDEGGESVASVLDIARSFEASYAHKFANSGESRSKSVPREKTVQWPLNEFNQIDQNDPRLVRDRRRQSSQESQPHFIDDYTITGKCCITKEGVGGKTSIRPTTKS